MFTSNTFAAPLKNSQRRLNLWAPGFTSSHEPDQLSQRVESKNLSNLATAFGQLKYEKRGLNALHYLECELTTSTEFCIRWSAVSACSLCTVIDVEMSEKERCVQVFSITNILHCRLGRRCAMRLSCRRDVQNRSVTATQQYIGRTLCTILGRCREHGVMDGI